jgi:hypothetical protein
LETKWAVVRRSSAPAPTSAGSDTAGGWSCARARESDSSTTVRSAKHLARILKTIAPHQAHVSHRAMAAILGVILKLAPAKQALASRQLRSRYLERLSRKDSSGTSTAVPS